MLDTKHYHILMIASLIAFILFTMGVCLTASALNVTNTSTTTQIVYQFEPALTENHTIYFNNEKIDYLTLSSLTMSGLTPGAGYTLTIWDNDSYYQEVTYTDKDEVFYTQYGFIGLFLLIVSMIYLSLKVPYLGYVSIVMSGAGLMYMIKYIGDTFTALIFMLLFIVSILVTAEAFKNG